MVIGLIALAGLGAVIASVSRTSGSTAENPAARLRVRKPHTDHKGLLTGPFAEGRRSPGPVFCVTRNRRTRSWPPRTGPGWAGGEGSRARSPLRIGKMNLINNFCIRRRAQYRALSACHAGYGWVDKTFDFSKQENVDCLVCHDTLGAYKKDHDHGGVAAEGVNLRPSRRPWAYPPAITAASATSRRRRRCRQARRPRRHDVFPQRADRRPHGKAFRLPGVPPDQNHRIPGRSMSVSVDDSNRVACTDCHAQRRIIRSGSTATPRPWPVRPATSRRWPSRPRRRWPGTGPPPDMARPRESIPAPIPRQRRRCTVSSVHKTRTR